MEAHLRCERSKFIGRPTDAIAPHQLIHQINTNNIILYPFSVDQFGSLGPIADSSLLFKRPPSSIPEYTYTFPHQPATTAHATTAANPLAILSTATSQWSYMYRRHTAHYFGSTHSSKTPAQWAAQTFALNVSKAIATHLSKHAQTHYLTHSNTSTVPTIGIPPTNYTVHTTEFTYQLGAHLQQHVFYV